VMSLYERGEARIQARTQRARVRCTIVVIAVVLIVVAIIGGSAGARVAGSDISTGHVGAVSQGLLRFLSSQGPGFLRSAERSTPMITRATAITDALRDGQWHPVAATGISLVRVTHQAGKVPKGTLAWLVSVRPRAPIYDSSSAPPANYVVVVISARNGHLLGDMAGYSRVLGHHPAPGWSEGEWA
jgi:hypothetical protein